MSSQKKSIWGDSYCTILFWRKILLKLSSPNSCRNLCDSAVTDKRHREWFPLFEEENFDVTDRKHEGVLRTFEEERQALLDEDLTQTEKQLVKGLNVAQPRISNRFHAIGKIRKKRDNERWKLEIKSGSTGMLT